MEDSTSIQIIQICIHTIRDERVMLDFDLAEMYEVETKNLNLAVKRNIKRFPQDFMFQLTKTEWESLRLQNATSNNRIGILNQSEKQNLEPKERKRVGYK